MPLPSPHSLAPQLAKLACLSVDDLKAEWSRVIGGVAPKNTRREYLLRAIAHRLQCDAHAGLSKTLRRALLKIAEHSRSQSDKPTAQPTRSLKAGARIFREWKGAVHEIEVVENGYRYRDKTYKSLSKIARQITGTRWSGPAFFGLKPRGSAEARHGV